MHFYRSSVAGAMQLTGSGEWLMDSRCMKKWGYWFFRRVCTWILRAPVAHWQIRTNIDRNSGATRMLTVYFRLSVSSGRLKNRQHSLRVSVESFTGEYGTSGGETSSAIQIEVCGQEKFAVDFFFFFLGTLSGELCWKEGRGRELGRSIFDI